MIVKSFLLLQFLAFHHQVKLVLKIMLLLLVLPFLLLKLNFHSVLLFLRMPFLLLKLDLTRSDVKHQHLQTIAIAINLEGSCCREMC
jgi:hypothetical protein